MALVSLPGMIPQNAGGPLENVGLLYSFATLTHLLPVILC